MALNSPLRASFSLSLSCLDLVGLKAARDGQVERLFDRLEYFFANQGPRRQSP